MQPSCPMIPSFMQRPKTTRDTDIMLSLHSSAKRFSQLRQAFSKQETWSHGESEMSHNVCQTQPASIDTGGTQWQHTQHNLNRLHPVQQLCSRQIQHGQLCNRRLREDSAQLSGSSIRLHPQSTWLDCVEGFTLKDRGCVTSAATITHNVNDWPFHPSGII